MAIALRCERSVGAASKKSPAKTNWRGECPINSASGDGLQFLGGPECNFLAGLYLNRLAGCGIAPHACGPVPDLQDAETGNADALSLFQMPGYQTDQIVQEIVSGAFGYVVVFGQTRRKMFKRH